LPDFWERKMKRPSAPTLTYAPRRRVGWGRRVVRVGVALLILGIALAGYHFRAAITYRVREYIAFREAMHHVTPPGTVLIERDATKANALIANDPAYFDNGTYVPLRPPNIVALTMTRWGRPPPVTAVYVPPTMRQLEQFVQTKSNDFSDNATVFLGQRRTPSGQRRLVIIRGASPTAGLLEHLSGIVIAPPTLAHGATWTNQSQSVSYVGVATTATLSPGIADPNDASHLTIAYSIAAEGTGTIDVRLNDDETLTFTVRPPAQQE
jgi:hypothetical protein